MKNISCIIYFIFQKYFQRSSFYFQLTKMYLFYFSFSLTIIILIRTEETPYKGGLVEHINSSAH